MNDVAEQLEKHIERVEACIYNTINYINLFAKELGVFYHQIKRRLEGKEV